VDAFDIVSGDFESVADVSDVESVHGESSVVRDESSASDFDWPADRDDFEAAHVEFEKSGRRSAADRFDFIVALFNLAMDQRQLVTTHDPIELGGGRVAAGKNEIATARGDIAAVG
jgi:hypothetical protein